MTTKPAEPVLISTADFSVKYADDVWVGVGGTPMLARCPKDSVWTRLGELERGGRIEAGEDELAILVHAVFGKENGDRAMAMVADPIEQEVTLESLGGLLGWCMERWGPDVLAHFEELQAGQGNRAQRRVVAKKVAAKKPGPKQATGKAPAGKAAAKKTTAKRAAAAKGR